MGRAKHVPNADAQSTVPRVPDKLHVVLLVRVRVDPFGVAKSFSPIASLMVFTLPRQPIHPVYDVLYTIRSARESARGRHDPLLVLP